MNSHFLKSKALCEDIDIMLRDMPPIIVAVDFDGTMVEDNFPNIGEPRDIMIEIQQMQRFCPQRVQFILWTCRNGKELANAVQYLSRSPIHMDAINENLPQVIEEWGGDTRKVYADLYCDDKAGNHNCLTEQVYKIAHKKVREHAQRKLDTIKRLGVAQPAG